MNFERSDDIKVSLRLGKRTQIINWLDTMGVKNYIINSDLTIYVKGNVYLDNKNLTEFPDYIKFNKVSNSFYCHENQLTSLKGCPTSVRDDFYCHTNQLSSLKGCPTIVGGGFSCYNNQLTSLEGCPISVEEIFYCGNPGKFTEEDVLKICKVKRDKIFI
jgi:hypothetical protein